VQPTLWCCRVDTCGSAAPIHLQGFKKLFLRNPDCDSYFPGQQLPLVEQISRARGPPQIAGCLRDGAPDFWGRRVIINRLTGAKGIAMDLESRSTEMNLYAANRPRPDWRAGTSRALRTEYRGRDWRGTSRCLNPYEAADLVETWRAPAAGAWMKPCAHGPFYRRARPKAAGSLMAMRKMMRNSAPPTISFSGQRRIIIPMKDCAACGMKRRPGRARQVMGKMCC